MRGSWNPGAQPADPGPRRSVAGAAGWPPESEVPRAWTQGARRQAAKQAWSLPGLGDPWHKGQPFRNPRPRPQARAAQSSFTEEVALGCSEPCHQVSEMTVSIARQRRRCPLGLPTQAGRPGHRAPQLHGDYTNACQQGSRARVAGRGRASRGAHPLGASADSQPALPGPQSTEEPWVGSGLECCLPPSKLPLLPPTAGRCHHPTIPPADDELHPL